MEAPRWPLNGFLRACFGSAGSDRGPPFGDLRSEPGTSIGFLFFGGGYGGKRGEHLGRSSFGMP